MDASKTTLYRVLRTPLLILTAGLGGSFLVLGLLSRTWPFLWIPCGAVLLAAGIGVGLWLSLRTARKLSRLVQQQCRESEHALLPELLPVQQALQSAEHALAAAAERSQQLSEELDRLQQALCQCREENSRLAYSRKQEVDPESYQTFLRGLNTLTAAEKAIFGYYVAGNSVRQVMELAQIKESTLRYHNRNIYSKLGVNSMKQLLRYAALMDRT